MRIRRVIAVLLVGVICNVAVAWAIVWWHDDVVARSDELVCVQAQGYVVSSASLFGYCNLTIVYLEESYWRRFTTELPDVPDYDGGRWWPRTDPPRSSLVTHIGCGWPARSLYSAWVRDDSRPARLRSEPEFKWGWPADAKLRRKNSSSIWPRIFPYRPLWFGFTVNTLFYAALVGLVWGGPGMIRRSIRRAKDRCAHCGYPRGASPVCTECGEPLSARGAR